MQVEEMTFKLKNQSGEYHGSNDKSKIYRSHIKTAEQP